MRLALPIVSAFCLLIGAVWILQGANLLAGSRMTGDPFWLWMGVLFLLVGAALAYARFRRSASHT